MGNLAFISRSTTEAARVGGVEEILTDVGRAVGGQGRAEGGDPRSSGCGAFELSSLGQAVAGEGSSASIR